MFRAMIATFKSVWMVNYIKEFAAIIGAINMPYVYDTLLR